MRLTTSNTEILNPPRAQIRRTLEGLDGDDNYFAILTADDGAFVQTAWSHEDGFILEYQDGDLSRHYRAKQTGIPHEAIVQAFSDYQAGNERWRTQFEWERLDLANAPSNGRHLRAFGGIACATGLALAYFAMAQTKGVGVWSAAVALMLTGIVLLRRSRSAT